MNSVTIIIPCRNEQGTIEAHVKSIPALGSSAEIIFVEGNSQDKTWEEILRVVAAYPEKNLRALKQPGKGKADAVRAALAVATGDICMIFDGDLTVPAEDLSAFYEKIQEKGVGAMLNGTRFVYPMQKRAMPFFNKIANRTFALGMSVVMRKWHTDMLCGTKVFFRSDYEKIRSFWDAHGSFDPFGDFDLLFGAYALDMSIEDVPMTYLARSYGAPNIRRWRHGLQLVLVFIKSVVLVWRYKITRGVAVFRTGKNK